MEQLNRSDKIVAQMGGILGNRYIRAIRNGRSVMSPVTISLVNIRLDQPNH